MTYLVIACIYNSRATEISKKFSLKYDFLWATSFIFYELGRLQFLKNLHENWRLDVKHI